MLGLQDIIQCQAKTQGWSRPSTHFTSQIGGAQREEERQIKQSRQELLEQGRLDKQRGAERRAQAAAVCGKCCHHYLNVIQISYLQLISHFAGNGTLD